MENLKKSFLVRGNNIVGFSDKKNFSTAPLGTVLSFAGQARPNGYLLCDGASYKVTDYPDLYAVIGNTYGGDSTNFNVPNLVDASQSPAPTMIYVIKAFHTNEGVDSDAGSGEENKIDSISVNGSPVSIDENKNVDITVPDAYDDTALVKRVSDIESDYAKTTEIPSKVSQLENDSNYLSSIPEEYVTETELEAKGYLTEHQDLSDYATKDEIPTVPSKVSELTNDSNYQTAEQVNSTVTTEITKVVANAPEDFDTLKEMSDWIAGHEDDASAMNSAISDNKANIETLQTDVANINTSLGGKLDKTFTGTDVANKILSTDGDGNVVLKDGNEDDTMLKSVYDTDDDGIVDKADSANIATNATDATNAENLKLSDGTIVNADTINTKLSKVDTTDNLSVELAKKIDKPASATDGQVLTYNGTSNKWEAQNAKGGAGKQVKSCEYAIERWLRFDPSNRKGLIIKAGTSIRNSQGNYIDFDSDTSVDLTSVITTAGEDYYVYMLDDGSITASLTSATAPSNSVRIGRFHSLCVAVGTCTMIVPPSGIAVGSNYLVKSYRQDEDLDFFNLYNKSVTATDTNNETLAHPLSGFEAGAILPESVMCLSFHSGSLFDDGQVYDKDIDAFIDIYLQSGIGLNTRSKYGATHTVSRTQGNHMVDMRQVGKKLLSDGEFESASIGSNQATNIQGSADKGTVGGHVDTANRRMISAIGAEEMCGYLWQWTRDVSSTGGSSWATTDGNGSFGQEYGTPFVLLAGGAWDGGSPCGSRSRFSAIVRSAALANLGGRGLSRVVRGV